MRIVLVVYAFYKTNTSNLFCACYMRTSGNFTTARVSVARFYSSRRTTYYIHIYQYSYIQFSDAPTNFPANIHICMYACDEYAAMLRRWRRYDLFAYIRLTCARLACKYTHTHRARQEFSLHTHTLTSLPYVYTRRLPLSSETLTSCSSPPPHCAWWQSSHLYIFRADGAADFIIIESSVHLRAFHI